MATRKTAAPFALADGQMLTPRWADMSSGLASPCSRRSAMTQSARISAWAMASAAVVPYASTPGSFGTSASQRPSLSRSRSSLSFMAGLSLAGEV